MPDWTKFTRRIFINSSPQKVFDAWAKPALITTWYLERADYYLTDGSLRDPNTYIQKGDRFKWKWYTWDGIEEGEVLENDEKTILRHTFADNCIVTIRVEAEGVRTHLILEQSNIPTDEKSKVNIFNGCSLGWSFWMINLKAWLEHGILLNEKSIEKTDWINTAEIVNA